MKRWIIGIGICVLGLCLLSAPVAAQKARPGTVRDSVSGEVEEENPRVKPFLNLTKPDDAFNLVCPVITDNAYDGTLGSMTCMSVVGPSTTISGMQVGLQIQHTWVGDLTVKVESPSAQVVTLMSRPGLAEPADDGTDCCGDSSDLAALSPVHYFDAAPKSAEDMGDNLGLTGVVCQDAPFECDYFPFPDSGPGTNLADYDGQNALGSWEVCVGDGALGDVGELCGVSITFAPAVCGNGTVDPGETCDPPGDIAGGNFNICRADCTVCGDAMVNGGEACDDGNGVNFDGCDNDCVVRPATVFVTSTSSDGNLGGEAGADTQCNVLAALAGLPLPYKAWISDDEGPATTFMPSTGPYALVDGTVIAVGFGDLTDGMLLAPINVTETGVVLAGPAGSRIWTGTSADGTPRGGGARCSEWTSSSFFDRGAQGRVDATMSNWSYAGASPCDRNRRLYCFQQPSGPGIDPPLPKLIFASSTQSNGNLGGIAGADATCNTLAAAAALPGTYKAWLSDSVDEPNTTFDMSALSYLTPCLTLVALGYGDLTDGTLLSPINCTESGVPLPGPSGSKIWTGTNAFGSKLQATCTGWTSGSSLVRGAQGRSSSAASTWSFSGASPCNQLRRIYCVEQ